MGLGVHGTSQRPAPAHVFDLVCLSWCFRYGGFLKETSNSWIWSSFPCAEEANPGAGLAGYQAPGMLSRCPQSACLWTSSGWV